MRNRHLAAIPLAALLLTACASAVPAQPADATTSPLRRSVLSGTT